MVFDDFFLSNIHKKNMARFAVKLGIYRAFLFTSPKVQKGNGNSFELIYSLFWRCYNTCITNNNRTEKGEKQ